MESHGSTDLFLWPSTNETVDTSNREHSASRAGPIVKMRALDQEAWTEGSRMIGIRPASWGCRQGISTFGADPTGRIIGLVDGRCTLRVYRFGTVHSLRYNGVREERIKRLEKERLAREAAAGP